MAQAKTFWDKFWYDKRGRLTVWQRPNALLWGFLATLVLYVFLPYGLIGKILGFMALAVILVWALLELFRGANYFRRTLGVGVLLLAALIFV